MAKKHGNKPQQNGLFCRNGCRISGIKKLPVRAAFSCRLGQASAACMSRPRHNRIIAAGPMSAFNVICHLLRIFFICTIPAWAGYARMAT